MKHVAIVGYGLIGRLLAVELAKAKLKISIYDPCLSGEASAAWIAAGMICPQAEIDAPQEILHWGADSLASWQTLAKTIGSDHWLRANGSLVTAHPSEQYRLQDFCHHLTHKSNRINNFTECKLKDIEKQLPNQAALFFENEGVVNGRALFAAIDNYLRHSQKVNFYQQTIRNLTPKQITNKEGQTLNYDWVYDCRGIKAKDIVDNLRGVRGEIITVHAPEVEIQLPIRLLHPRYPLYVVPRDNHHYVIGASEIETEILQPISVRSTLELLTAAFSLHPGFAEAVIIETNVGLRPTTTDHLPYIKSQNGLTIINGLYRHGFLLAPYVVQQALNQKKLHENNYEN